MRKVRERNPFTSIEILPSDMGGDYDALETLMASKPDIINHNIETVRRLTPRVRARATYDGKLRKVAMDKGFKHCQAGPLVRSSYHADEQVNEAAKERHRIGEEKLGNEIGTDTNN